MNSSLWSQISQRLLLAVFLIIPLSSAYRSYGYEQIKVILFCLFVSIAGIFWFIATHSDQKQYKLTTLHYLSLLFLGTLLISSFMGLNWQESVIGRPPYFQGLITYSLLFCFSLLVSWSKTSLKQWIYCLFASTIIVSLLALFQFIQIHLLDYHLATYAGRVVSSFGQPNFYAGFLLICLPLFWSWSQITQNISHSRRLLVGLGVMIVAMFLSYSRTVIGFLVIALLFLLAQRLKYSKLVIILIVGVILIASYYSLHLTSGLVWQEIQQPSDLEWLYHNSPEKRAVIWPLLWQQAQDHLVFGYGLEMIPEVFGSFKDKLFDPFPPWYFSVKDLIIDRSHSYLLDILLFSGIFGVISYLLLVSNLIKRLWVYKPLLISLFIYLIWAQFQNQSIMHLIFFWWLIGWAGRDNQRLGFDDDPQI